MQQDTTERQEARGFLNAIQQYQRHAGPLAALDQGDRAGAARAWEALAQQDAGDYRTAHHLAVLHHGWAMELEASEQPDEAADHWRKGLAAWHRVWKSDAFWQAISEKGRGLGRDFRLETVEELRADLPYRLMRINTAYVNSWLERYRDQMGLQRQHAQVTPDSPFLSRAGQHLTYILESPFPEALRQVMRNEIARPSLDEAERLSERGDYEGTVQRLEVLLTIDPDLGEARTAAADAYCSRGLKLYSGHNAVEARRSFERALVLVPNHEAAQRHLQNMVLDQFARLFRS